MQLEDVIKLRKEWVEAGDLPCDHPYVVREYHLGSNTGDKVCTTCGDYPDLKGP